MAFFLGEQLALAERLGIPPVPPKWLVKPQPERQPLITPPPRRVVQDVVPITTVANDSIAHRFCTICGALIEDIGPQAANTFECPHCHNRIPVDDL